MGSALDAFAIDGFRHNIPFLAVLMRNERWREGRLSTKFIAEEFPERLQAAQAGRRGARCAGGGRRGDRPYEQCARRAITQQMHGEPVRFAETRVVELGEERVKVSVAGGSTSRLS